MRLGPDAGPFCARLLRLDPAAVVRIRPAGPGVAARWARLPFDPLVTRLVPGDVDDMTVSARDLLDHLDGGPPPARRDGEWRWALPGPVGESLESSPADVVRQVAAAAADTVRASVGRGVGERRVRDVLLDHVAVTVTQGEEIVAVPQRLVQAVARMGFLGEDPVTVRRIGRWVGLTATYGAGWYRPPAAGLQVRPAAT